VINLEKEIKIPKIETKLEVKNEADSETAELYLYGTIRQAYWWDDEDEENIISAKGVKNALKNLKGKNINVHINSGGGDVFESIAIGNLLKQHDGKVNIVIDGLAGSGASVVAMAGEKITMFPNSMMMIHKAWTFAMGNANELRKTADDLDKIDSAVKASYQNRFVGTNEELEDLIAEESWLTAEECLAFGFCDEIIEEETAKEEPAQNSVKENLFNKYKKNIANKQVGDKKPALFNAFKKQKLGGNE
jgi:ATP-dependent Clp protease protease subunit